MFAYGLKIGVLRRVGWDPSQDDLQNTKQDQAYLGYTEIFPNFPCFLASFLFF